MPDTLVELKELTDAVRKNSENLSTLGKNFDGFVEQMKRTPATGAAGASDVFGLPHARVGENALSSRGFSFLKMLGLLTGACTPEEAKVELHEVHDRLHKHFVTDLGSAGYEYKGNGASGQHRFLAPLATSFFQDNLIDRKTRLEFKQLVHAGTDGADPGQVAWIRRKHLQDMGYSQKALSWLNELTGGALVAPPEMGELIELLRNREALVNAGARVVPLPPQGRLKMPRQTAASLTYWVGENSPITESLIGTGEITLQAKKLAVLIKSPNELIRFATPAAEALLRDDMTKSLALALDLACLEGQGGDNRPRGLINFPNINVVASSNPGANGDGLVGQDIYRAVAAVEESNAEFETWVMRPKTLYKWYQLRTDAVSQGDSAGPFLFNLVREAGADTPPMLASYPVVKSTQISQSRAKGSATNLTYIIGGRFSEALIGMFGALEFAATAQGDTSFLNDQTWVRGILSADFQLRHEAAFVLIDNLDTTI